MIFITETECVYCAVRTEPINIIQAGFGLQNLRRFSGFPVGLANSQYAAGRSRDRQALHRCP